MESDMAFAMRQLELFGKEYKEISRQIFFDMISLGIGKIGIRGYGKSEIM